MHLSIWSLLGCSYDLIFQSTFLLACSHVSEQCGGSEMSFLIMVRTILKIRRDGLGLSSSDSEQVTSRIFSDITCKIRACESDCLVLNISSNYSEVLVKLSRPRILQL